MDNKFSRSNYMMSSFKEVAHLNFELTSYIKGRIDEISSAKIEESEKVTNFLDLCESIADDLNSLGHGLGRIDYDGDIRYDHNSQIWGTRFQNENPLGLEIEFRTDSVNVLWLIGSGYRE